MRIHANAAVHSADDPVRAHPAIRDRHLRDLGHEAPEGLVDGEAPEAAFRKRLSPTRLFRGEVQGSQVPRMILQQPAAVRQGILRRGPSELVDEGFHDDSTANGAQSGELGQRLLRFSQVIPLFNELLLRVGHVLQPVLVLDRELAPGPVVRRRVLAREPVQVPMIRYDECLPGRVIKVATKPGSNPLPAPRTTKLPGALHLPELIVRRASRG